MNEFKQMEDRNFSKPRTAIGASDYGTLAGVNPYQTAMQLYDNLLRAKRGELPEFQGNDATRAGNDCEALILSKVIEEWYDKETAVKFMISRLKGEERCGDFYSWTEADDTHADLVIGLITGNIIIEAKKTNFLNSKTDDKPYQGYSKTDMTGTGVPLSVYFQIQAQMHAYNIGQAFVACMFGNSHYLYGPIDYSEEVANKLEAMKGRMISLVESETPPEPKTFDDLMYLYPEVVKGKVLEVEEGHAIFDNCIAYSGAQKKIKEYTEMKDRSKLAIGKIMKDYQSCEINGDTVLKMAGKSGSRYPKIGKDFK